VFRTQRFEAGDPVRHPRRGFRAVVSSCDPECRADEGWYRAVRPRSERAQPWYHLLVHGSGLAYVAEDELVPDTSGEQIGHPLVARLFASFSEGRYQVRRPEPVEGVRR